MTLKQKLARDAELKRLRDNPRKHPTYRDGFNDAVDMIRKKLATQNGYFADEFYKLNIEKQLDSLEEFRCQVVNLNEKRFDKLKLVK